MLLRTISRCYGGWEERAMDAKVSAEPRQRPWDRLQGKIAPAVLFAPKTCGDPHHPDQWPAVHEKVVGVLERNVVGKAWGDNLALFAAIQTARRRDPVTVKGKVLHVNGGFKKLFRELGLVDMSEWLPDTYIPAYLRGDLIPTDTDTTRYEFLTAYGNISKVVTSWAESLPSDERAQYLPLMLPAVTPAVVQGIIRKKDLSARREQVRKAETDAVVARFSDLRAEAHLRYNRMLRLHRAYQQAISELAAAEREGHPHTLPFAFSYEEGGDESAGVAPVERLHFRIWDRKSFVFDPSHAYSTGTLFYARRGMKAFTPANNKRFLEFVAVESLRGDVPPRGLWFTDIFKLHLSRASHRPKETLEWLRSWGYGQDVRKTLPFNTMHLGLLNWVTEGGEKDFIMFAQRRARGTLIPVESTYAAVAFGLAALDLFTTTGMRINEAMQIKLTQDCLVRTTMPPPPGARDQSPRTRYLLRLIPKGERRDVPADYYISRETVRTLTKTARMLDEHYALSVDGAGSLPIVPFNRFAGRSHRFGADRYLFQFSHQHLGPNAIAACLRFLAHGVVLRTSEGDPVVLKPHLLRHVFATHAVQVEHVPLDIMGSWLKQKNLAVTDYYSKPTPSMVAEAADGYMMRLAAQINVEEAIQRSPVELQRLFEEAKGKVGALAEVVGGTCSIAGYCPAKFVCIGCPGKIPDPAKRYQVERKKVWALRQVTEASAEGLLPEAERMKQLVRDCDVEMREMEQIEAYRRDENREAHLQFDA
jgi:hypothetical protein